MSSFFTKTSKAVVDSVELSSYDRAMINFMFAYMSVEGGYGFDFTEKEITDYVKWYRLNTSYDEDAENGFEFGVEGIVLIWTGVNSTRVLAEKPDTYEEENFLLKPADMYKIKRIEEELEMFNGLSTQRTERKV